MCSTLITIHYPLLPAHLLSRYTVRMLWYYSRNDTKILLIATLLVFSGYALLLAQDWRAVRFEDLQQAQTIGVLASVPSNEMNTLAQQLDTRARELDAREAAILSAGQGDTRTLVAVGVVGAALLGLILFNFYLDTKRRVSLM